MKVQKSATTPYLTSKNTIYKPKNSEICLEPQPRITNADNYTKRLRHNRLVSIIIFAQNHLAKGVLTSFSIVSHKSNPWKKGTMKVYWNAPLQPQIMGFISRKNPKMYQNHTAKVVTWLFSMYISYKWVLWGCFCIITHKLPPLEWNTRATQFEGITGINLWNLHENTEVMGFMSSLFHYYTQITPLENGDYTVWMDYKEKIQKFEWKHQGTGFSSGFMARSIFQRLRH